MPRALLVFLGVQTLLVTGRLGAIDSDRPWAPWLKAGSVLALLLMYTWLLVRMRFGRTIVGPDGVTTRGAVMRRHRAWPDLYDIRVEPTKAGAMAPEHSTLAYGTDGRRLPLFFVDSRQCDDLLAEVEAIRTDGAAWRDRPWIRLPEVEEKIRRRALRRDSWNWAFICMICSYVPALFFVFWRLFHHEEGHPVLFFVWGPLAVLLACLTLFVATESRRPFPSSRPGVLTDS
ncbi:PH domain-containing protein [Streptomyces sp. NBC_00647]|uniref:PH domain-containing protein n=1 Tax=Streptomyces sp. NBC_00647 TaxID=2975796 RepID=UPI0032452F52